MNHIINGNYFPLEPRWIGNLNFTVFQNYSVRQIIEAKSRPAIIHFIGALKPWYYLSRTSWQKIYWKYRRLTPWPQKEYKDKTLKKTILKFLREIIFLFGDEFERKLRIILRLGESDIAAMRLKNNDNQ
jgi:lipopolysaccharide biosynthesis glycosyltransferase